MKNKSATSRSAFLNPRVVISLAFCAIGVLLTLLAFALYPGGNALAAPKQQQNQSGAAALAQNGVTVPDERLTEGPTPTLGNYPDTSILLNTDATVTPDAAPTHTTSINVSTSTNFKGTLTGDPLTGAVRVTNAMAIKTSRFPTASVCGFSWATARAVSAPSAPTTGRVILVET